MPTYDRIDRDGNAQPRNLHPLLGNRNYTARHDHGKNAHCVELWQEVRQLAMPHKGFTAN